MSISCRVNKTQWIKADNVDVNEANSCMPYYFRSIINRPRDKRASVLINEVYSEFSDVFQVLCALREHLDSQAY